MKIIDKTSYTQREGRKGTLVPRIIRIETDGGKSFTIHRHTDYPGTWLLSTEDEKIKDLHTDSIKDAAASAIKYLIEKNQDKIRAIQAMNTDLQLGLNELDSDPVLTATEKKQEEAAK